jgi:hypothetical protein
MTLDRNHRSDLATGADTEIEEERRLLYVAMTRARDELHLMIRSVFTHGQTTYRDHVTPRGLGSCPTNWLVCSIARLGQRLLQNPPPHGRRGSVFGLTPAHGCETCEAEAGRLTVGHIRNDAPRKWKGAD